MFKPKEGYSIESHKAAMHFPMYVWYSSMVLLHLGCVLSQNSCPDHCKCKGTPIVEVDCQCSAYQIKLPPQMLIYKQKVCNELSLGYDDFSNFTSLESLQYSTVSSEHAGIWQPQLTITRDNQRVLWPLKRLRELRINLPWQLNTDLPEFLQGFSELELLDLSNTGEIDGRYLKTLLHGLEKSKSLRFLYLHNYQTANPEPIFLIDVDLAAMTECPLEELDISYNVIYQVSGGLIETAPMLKKLNVSNNMIDVDRAGRLFFEVILHPTLMEADLSEQGFGQCQTSLRRHGLMSPRDVTTTSGGYRARHEKKDDLHDLLFDGDKTCSVAKAWDDLCIVFSDKCASLLHEFTVNHETFCKYFSGVVAHYSNIPMLYTNLPCDSVPPASSLLNPNCAGCIVFPLAGNIRRLHMQRIKSFADLLPLPMFQSNSCYYPNNSLEYINLSNNGLHNITADIRNLSKLSVIDLSRNKLQSFRMDMRNLSMLSEINLSWNRLESFAMDMQTLRNLSVIDLSTNLISSLSPDMMSQLSKHAARLKTTTLKINLFNNPLLCTCNVRDFTDWVLSQPENIEFVYFHKYRCLNDVSNQVLFHKLSESSIFDCLSSNVYIGIGVGSGVLLSLIVAALIAGVHRKRWWIRYHYYVAKKMWVHSRKQEDMSREYRWDVFVSYNRYDSDWVDEVLRAKLEDENRIQLCLHERDFELGQQITDLIIESIENSRKTLLILSPHFIQSNWCKFEMQMAHQKLFTAGQDVLLLAILKPLDNVEISKTLKALLEQKNYVQWSDDEYGQKLFWAKLITALDIPKRHCDTEEGCQDDNAPLLGQTNSQPFTTPYGLVQQEHHTVV